MQVAENRHPVLPVDAAQNVEDGAGGGGVEAGHRLVGENDFRFLHEGTGDAHSLPLAAAQLVRPLTGLAADLQPLQMVPRGVHICFRKMIDQRPPGRGSPQRAGKNIGLHRQTVHQVVVLEDHPGLLAQGSEAWAVQGGHLLIVEKYFARGGFHQPVDASEESGFPGAAAPEDDGELAGREGQRHLIQSAGAVAVNFGNLFETQHRPGSVKGWFSLNPD